MIKATAAAIPHLKRILGNYKAVFFGATGGGCNGFKYILQPTNTVDGSNHDELVSVGGVPIVICGKSMFLVLGTEIDWTEDHMVFFYNERLTSKFHRACGNKRNSYGV